METLPPRSNPAETLLAAAGGCITSSMGLVASNSGVQIDGLKVKVTGVRQDSPPKIISIHYELTIDSPDTDRRIDSIFKVARRNSTVLSTLRETMELKGEWHR
ncbi:MAG: OsmC family protein [Spirochaetia bacterium]|nr:OsmC family protein [Spirochaetia bacterium]